MGRPISKMFGLPPDAYSVILSFLVCEARVILSCKGWKMQMMNRYCLQLSRSGNRFYSDTLPLKVGDAILYRVGIDAVQTWAN